MDTGWILTDEKDQYTIKLEFECEHQNREYYDYIVYHGEKIMFEGDRFSISVHTREIEMFCDFLTLLIGIDQNNLNHEQKEFLLIHSDVLSEICYLLEEKKEKIIDLIDMMDMPLQQAVQQAIEASINE